MWINERDRAKRGYYTHRHFPCIQLLPMGNLLILDSPQRVQRLISLIPGLSRLRQRTRELAMSLFLRFRELENETISGY